LNNWKRGPTSYVNSEWTGLLEMSANDEICVVRITIIVHNMPAIIVGTPIDHHQLTGVLSEWISEALLASQF